jgi:hypothetical protein
MVDAASCYSLPNPLKNSPPSGDSVAKLILVESWSHWSVLDTAASPRGNKHDLVVLYCFLRPVQCASFGFDVPDQHAREGTLLREILMAQRILEVWTIGKRAFSEVSR